MLPGRLRAEWLRLAAAPWRYRSRIRRHTRAVSKFTRRLTLRDTDRATQDQPRNARQELNSEPARRTLWWPTAAPLKQLGGSFKLAYCGLKLGFPSQRGEILLRERSSPMGET